MKLEGPGRVFSQPACGNEVWIKTNISGTVGKPLSPLAFRPSSPSVKSLFEATVHRHVADIEVGAVCVMLSSAVQGSVKGTLGMVQGALSLI